MHVVTRSVAVVVMVIMAPGCGDNVDSCDDGCLIGDICLPDGFVDPSNACQLCDSTGASEGWSDNDGAPCNDGAFCTVNDTCSAGACAGTTRDCSDGVVCNGDESCNEADDACQLGANQCGAGFMCDVGSDTCVTTCTGCEVSGMCYTHGQLNPANSCLVCDTSSTTIAFSNDDGAPCDDDAFCTGDDTCAAGSCSAHAGDPCAGAGDSCFEAEDRCCAPAAYQQCNFDGFVASYDSCDREESVVDDCSTLLNPICVAATCICATGYSGATCADSTCGDGELAAGAEECDDEDTFDGDGCSALCAVEVGYSCVGQSPTFCAANPCVPDLVAPANGNVDATTGVYNDVRTFSCDVGYSMTGFATTTCGPTGIWSNAAPTCEANPCSPALVAPPNGSVDSTTGSTGDVSTFTCDAGYSLVGTSTTTCQSDGTWSSAAPTCQANACPNLVAPQDGAVDGLQGVTGDVRTFSCNYGFNLVGSSTITCGVTSEWSASAPTCVPFPCVSYVEPAHGSVASDGLNPPTLTFSCQAGYVLTGDATSICTSSGAWSNPPPTCDALPCTTTLSAPEHGSLIGSPNGVTGDMRMYACDAGYTLSGLPETTCQSDGTWSSPAPTCQANACPSLSAPAHGSVSGVSGVTGDMRMYACDAGYTLSGLPETTCLPDGTWSSTAPTCEANPCPDLSAPDFGAVDSPSGVTGVTRTYWCDAGYSLVGTSTTTCQPDSTWSTAAPTCEAI